MQRDYILRMIEQAGTVLRALLKRILRREVQLDEVTRDLRQAAALGGLDIDLLRLGDENTVLLMVAPGGEPEPARTWLAAEMLYLDGLAAQLDECREEAALSFGKARLLFGLAAATGVFPSGFPEAAERIRDIDERLTNPPSLPACPTPSLGTAYRRPQHPIPDRGPPLCDWVCS